ncbi:MAG: fasciclin domain-containing protein [Acidimicrobiia bacterium]|nr:fasciclin domain-containing protein [Acidimicrobiia bacterium]
MADTVHLDDGEEDDRGLPLFWGLLFVALVTVIAVLLFREVDFEASPVPSTLAEPPATTSTTSQTLVDVLRDDPRFATFTGLIDQAGLEDMLSTGAFTVFAPTDSAMALVGLPADGADVSSFVLRHVRPGRVEMDQFAGTDGYTFKMMSGDIVRTGESSVGGSSVDEGPIEAGDGYVYVMRRVIAVEEPGAVDLMTADGRFGSLLDALEVAGLSLDGADVTVLAPTDDAFAQLPEGVLDQLLSDPDRLTTLLEYHLVPGSMSGRGSYITAGGAEVTVTDADVNGVPIASTDGPIVALEGVLVPPGFVLADVNDILELAPITFEVGSAVITSEGQAELDRAIDYLLANPVRIEIGGHTDADGAEDANLALSEVRAQAVVDYLESGGLDSELLTAIGYGESQPIASNDTEEGKAQNRRIEFSILG